MDQEICDRLASASDWLTRGAEGKAPLTLAASMASHLIITAMIRYCDGQWPDDGQLAA